jgi:hypothetical protein
MLSWKAQLNFNCICDHAAKQRITIDGIESDIPGRMFPLEPISLFVHREKMTSETGGADLILGSTPVGRNVLP